MTRDILDDCIDGRIRGGEMIAAVAMTTVVTKMLDAAGLCDQIDSAFDWFVILAAIAWLSYCIAGSVHDMYTKHRERRYTSIYIHRQEEAS